MSNYERYKELTSNYKIKHGLYGLVTKYITPHSPDYENALKKLLRTTTL